MFFSASTFIIGPCVPEPCDDVASYGLRRGSSGVPEGSGFESVTPPMRGADRLGSREQRCLVALGSRVGGVSGSGWGSVGPRWYPAGWPGPW